MLCPRYKLAYVVVRKAANTAIHSYLSTHLGGHFDWCRIDSCLSAFGKCTTLCLRPEHLDEYFFFSFVMHPVRRFFKALTTITPRHGHLCYLVGDTSVTMRSIITPTLTSITRRHQLSSPHMPGLALRLLHAMQHHAHPAEHHLETQARI